MHGADGDEDFRISLAGAQEKTALTKMGRHWYRPLTSTPTTHILKLPLGLVGNRRLDLSHSVDNEWLCAALLRELNLVVANTDISQFGDQRALVVERFDRRWQNVGDGDPGAANFEPLRETWIARIPQEDFCQVAGLPHTRKYENEGGPSMRDILNDLARAEHPDSDQQRCMLSQLAFWMLAATDGHAKNFSISHHRRGRFSLTGAAARPVMKELAGRVAGAIDAVEKLLPQGFAEPVWAAISTGLRKQAKSFLAYAKA